MNTAQQELAERLAEAASGDEPDSDVNYILNRSERDTIVTTLRAHDDMLALLKELKRQGGLGYDVHKRIDAAIAKAGSRHD